MARVPERLVWAVEALAPRPGERVLEVGCGNGVAAELLLSTHPHVKLTVIDRSATAIAACRRRLAPFVEAGRATVVRTELAKFTSRTKFDRAFAINVNSFWRDAGEELYALSRVLSPGGDVLLVFEPPSASQNQRIADACAEQLCLRGFSHVTASRRGAMLAVAARSRRS